MRKNIGKRIKAIGFVLMLTISVLLSFTVTVSADPIPNEIYALIVPQGYTSWSDINTTGHVEMGDTFNVTFNITINEEINSIGLDNITFLGNTSWPSNWVWPTMGESNYTNGTGTVTQGDALVGGSTTTWMTTDWSTNDAGYAAPLATWAKTVGTNNSKGVICNTTWNAIVVGYAFINFTDSCGCSYGATDKVVNFHNGTIIIHPSHPTSPSATSINSSEIDLSWTKGNGADNTVIVAKLGSLPIDISDSSATIIYNNTGTSYQHTGLNPSEHWYYRLYSWNNSFNGTGIFSIYNTTADATTSEGNQPPTFTNPSIVNGSSGVDIPSSWSITINDPEGDSFNWTIQTNPNIGNISQNGDSNGSKSVTLTNVQYNTMYTVYVNATDSGSNEWTRHWYTFTTRSETVPGIPNSFTATANGRFNIDLSWAKGGNADYTYIEWRNTPGTWNRGDETMLYNNTGTTTSQSGLSPGATIYYQAWSYNTTDNTWSSSYATGHNTTNSNTAPSFSNENPTNGSIDQEILFTWQVSISDPDGDSFNWTIECSNGQTSNSNEEGNGTKSLFLNNLAYSTLYTIWVNATDSYNWTRHWYTFTTKNEPANYPPTFGNPSITNKSTNIPINTNSWSISMGDPEGDSFNWSIQTNPNIGNISQNNEHNGTKICPLSGLTYSTNYTVYVNATDSGSGNWTNRTFWFITENHPNQHPNPPVNPTPNDNAPDIPINVGGFSCLVSDPDGDSLNCSAYWSNHTLIDTNNSVANNTIVSFDVGTLLKNTTYHWYVNVSDGEYTTQGPIWNFTTVDNNAPVASFTLDVDNATQKIWVNDTSTDSDGTVVYWSWDFDDGTNVHTQNAVHTYSTGGSYILSLAIIDNDGGSDTKSLGFTLNYPPSASFLYTASDMNVTVNSTSTDHENNIVNWTWDWDDGNYSYTENATHEYTTAGTYIVNLTVQDNYGSVTSTWNAVTVPPAATAGFIENVDWLVIGVIIASILAGIFFVVMIWKG